MPKLDEIFSGSFLKAADLPQNQPVQVKIESAEIKEFEDGKKIIINFAGKDKALVCNKTNASRIAEVTGSDDTDMWEGKRITLAVRRVEYQGKLVPAIRVLLPDELPTKAKHPEPEPEEETGDPNW